MYIHMNSAHTFGIRKFLQHICCSVSIVVVWWYFVVKFSYTVYSCCTILYSGVLKRSGVLLSCATTDCCFEDEHLNSAVFSYLLCCIVLCDIVLCFAKLWIVLFCVVLHCGKCCATMCKVLMPPVRFSGFLPCQPRLHLPSR